MPWQSARPIATPEDVYEGDTVWVHRPDGQLYSAPLWCWHPTPQLGDPTLTPAQIRALILAAMVPGSKNGYWGINYPSEQDNCRTYPDPASAANRAYQANNPPYEYGH